MTRPITCDGCGAKALPHPGQDNPLGWRDQLPPSPGFLPPVFCPKCQGTRRRLLDDLEADSGAPGFSRGR